MTADNAEQIASWNAEVGARWTTHQERLDALLAPISAAALALAAAAPGERVLDIGCGCGATTLALADAVGPGGRVLGVDVSAPMLARARTRTAAYPQVDYLEADAARAALPGANDLLFSRFGVMFFADPVGAFRAMRAALRGGARAAFVCWRPFMENPWATVPAMAGLRALGVTPPPSDPLAPGPFAFADGARVRTILADAGYDAIAVERFDTPMVLGADAQDAAALAMELGPLGSLVRTHGGGAAVRDAVTAALGAHETAQGIVLEGSAWLVSARAP